MRGGTSKALMFHRHDLPMDIDLWPELFIAALGANDPYGRQLDGMGGGVSSLSKVCVISPSRKAGADIDYTFFQVTPTTNSVDLSASCGNMAAAVGPFAVDEGLVTPTGAEAHVRIFSSNTDRMIYSTFCLHHGKAAVDGNMSLPGVAGSGSPVRLEFEDPGGGVTGRLLPTGKALDDIQLLDSKPISVSMADAGNTCVFVKANDLGLEGTELPDCLERSPGKLETLESIRSMASVAMGIARNMDEAHHITGIPKVAFLSPAQDAMTLSGNVVTATECDLTVRMISLGQPHRAIPVTGALCTAVVAGIDSSLANGMLGNSRQRSEVRLAHPSGVVKVNACLERQNGIWHAKSATIYRTARRLMDGYVYVSSAHTPRLEVLSGS